jgi:4-hydroxy-2-oxoheptanedioate aldolase
LYDDGDGTDVSTVDRGIWAISGDPSAAAQLSTLGFDWLCLDAQHGRFDDASVGATLAARRDDSVPVWVRVLSTDAALIGRALDAGATGVIVPMVNTAEQAAAVVSASKYPPIGVRSWGPFLGAYDRDTALPDAANASTSCAVMIETSEALENVDAIAATPGVDMLFVGPFDLAIALGVPLAELLSDGSALRAISDAARGHGVRAGAFAGTPERAAELAAHGYDVIAIATDAELTARGAAAVLSAP